VNTTLIYVSVPPVACYNATATIVKIWKTFSFLLVTMKIILYCISKYNNYQCNHVSVP
jgi:hypothetical protein